MRKMVNGFLALAVVLMSAGVAMATDPAPSYTIDLSQVTLDITTAVTSLIGLALVIFGGRKVLSLVKRG